MPIVDIPLTTSIDRASSKYNMKNIADPSYQENNTLLWRGGLSPIKVKKYPNSTISFNDDIVTIDANSLIINGEYRGLLGEPVNKPTNEKVTIVNGYLQHQDRPDGSQPVWGVDAYVQFHPDLNQFFLHWGTNIQPIPNTNSQFSLISEQTKFFVVTYECLLINGTTNRRQMFIVCNEGSPNNIAYLVNENIVQFNSIAFGPQYVTHLNYKWCLTFVEGSPYAYVEIDSRDNEELYRLNWLVTPTVCYSKAVGAGYFLYLYRNSYNYYQWATNVGNGYTGVVGSTGSARVIDFGADTASQFNYVKDGLVIVNGEAVGFVYNNTRPFGPVICPLFTYSFFLSGMNGWIVDDIYIPRAPYTYSIERISQSTLMINDGTIIGDEIEHYLPLNLTFITPLVLSDLFGGGSQHLYQIQAGNNVNYQVTNKEQSGGIGTPITLNIYGELENVKNVMFSSGNRGPNGIWPEDGQYFIGVDGQTPSYWFSCNELSTDFEDPNLVGLLAPTLVAPLVPIPPNATAVKNIINNAVFKWSNDIFISEIFENKTLMMYDFMNYFTNMNSIFWLKGSYFVFDGTNIYSSGDSLMNVSFNTIAARAPNMKFLGADSNFATFWSDADGTVYAFGADYSVQPFIDYSNITIKDASFNQSMNTFCFLSDDEVIFSRMNSAALPIAGDSIYTTKNNIVVQAGKDCYAISLKGNDNYSEGVKLSSNYLFIKDGIVNSYSDINFRIKKLVDTNVKYELKTEVMLTDGNISAKNTKGVLTFKEGEGLSIVRMSGLGTGRALSFTLSTDAPVQIQGIWLSADPVAKTPVVSRGMV
jgi:hypothetical protein